MVEVTANYSNQKYSAMPNKVIEIFHMEDFPAPSAGVITLEDGTLYIVSAPLVTGDRFVLPAGSTITLRASNDPVNTLIYTGTGTFISSAGPVDGFFIDNIRLISSGSGATLFSVQGLGAPTQSTFRARFCVFIGFTNLGTVFEFFIDFHDSSGFINYTNGIENINDNRVVYDQNLFISNGAGNNAGLRITGTTTDNIRLELNTLTTFGNSDGYYVSPTVNENCKASINNTLRSGTGNFYENGLTGTINSFADVSAAAGAVATVDDASGIAQFNRVAHGLVVGDVITHTGFATGNYNGSPFTVSVVPDANSYQAFNTVGDAINFEGDDTTGSVQNRRVRITTAAAHGITSETPTLILGTFNYNGGYDVLNASASVFDIQKVFVNTQTGSFDTGSITGAEPRLISLNNFPIQNSMVSGEVGFTASPITSPLTVTIATQGTPVLIAGTAWTNNKLERMEVDPSGNGLMKYLADATLEVPITFTASIEKVGGGTVHIGLAVIINGVLTTAATFEPPITVNTGVIEIGATRLFTLSKNDTIQLAVVNFNGTSNIEVTQAEMTVGNNL